jgi:NTP pyrophosphatase (non-canonical NTP hydrolase)
MIDETRPTGDDALLVQRIAGVINDQAQPGVAWTPLTIAEAVAAELGGPHSPKSLGEMTAEVDTLVHEKGWRDRPVSFGEAMATLHSEVSEALEAWRVWGLEDKTGPDIISNDASGELRWPGKPLGVGSEFADVLIRLLDDCALFGVDLEAEYERKMAYNRSRTYRHGGKRL